jgi:Ser/Thr protein kinase RdoA (MazF antagonist)
MKVRYAFQKLENLPEGFEVPAGRVKPWGTAHAILSCKDMIDGPFAVINADDYYGREAFKQIYDYLSVHEDNEKYQYAMVGYQLKNTLTENGSVARGVCDIDSNGKLVSVTEHTTIVKRGDNAAYTEDDGKSYTDLAGDTIVSMNLWGFSKGFLSEIAYGFRDFLQEGLQHNPLKCEYYLPSVVSRLLDSNKAEVKVLLTTEKWYGVTYREDKPMVMTALKKLEENNFYPKQLCGKLEAAANFCFEGVYKEEIPWGNGHINDTYRVTFENEQGVKKHYILQQMNKSIFKNPVELMENTVSYDLIDNPEILYEGGLAFGRFQSMLADYPAKTLHETIPGFHDTRERFETFKKAVEEDVCSRVDLVREEIQFVLDREEIVDCFQDLLRSGKISFRVTHNDTKINNVLMDKDTKKGICVIDLDTVMPGAAMNDFGDAVRIGASTALEDEQNLDKVWCDLELFEACAKGFIEGCGGKLSQEEIKLLPMGARLMTYECGMRFLIDYIQGDIYFKIHRPRQNLDRARTQFKLVSDMEHKWKVMENIVKKYM